MCNFPRFYFRLPSLSAWVLPTTVRLCSFDFLVLRSDTRRQYSPSDTPSDIRDLSET